MLAKQVARGTKISDASGQSQDQTCARIGFALPIRADISYNSKPECCPNKGSASPVLLSYSRTQNWCLSVWTNSRSFFASCTPAHNPSCCSSVTRLQQRLDLSMGCPYSLEVEKAPGPQYVHRLEHPGHPAHSQLPVSNRATKMPSTSQLGAQEKPAEALRTA